MRKLILPCALFLLSFSLCEAAGTGEIPWEKARVLRTPHFDIKTNLPQRRAEECEQMLETLYKGFVRHCAEPLGREIPAARMPVYFFANQGDFAAYCRRFLPGAEKSAGLFDTGNMAAFLFDRKEEAGVTTVREAVFHECTHQLWWNLAGRPTGNVSSRPFFWVSEGLATLFETLDDSGELNAISAGRFARAMELVRDNKAVPLEEFSSYTVSHLHCRDQEESRKRYAQAMALATFFMIAENRKYRDRFLKVALGVESGVGSSALFKKIFEKPVSAYQDEWLRFLQAPAPKADLEVRSGPPKAAGMAAEINVTLPPNPNQAFWKLLLSGQQDNRVISAKGFDEIEAMKKAMPGSRIIRTNHFILVSDLSLEGAQAVGQMAEALFEHYCKAFGLEVNPMHLLRAYNLVRSTRGQDLAANETMKIAYFQSSVNFDRFVTGFLKMQARGGAGFTDASQNAAVFRSVAGSEVPTDGFFTHELTHLFLNAANLRVLNGMLPWWLDEGAATYNEPLRVEAGKVTNAAAVNLQRLKYVADASLDIERIIEINERVRGASANNLAYSQVWALYHFLRDSPKYRDRFKSYEQAIYISYFATSDAAAAHGARIFHEVFGADLKAMNEELRAHVRQLKTRR